MTALPPLMLLVLWTAWVIQAVLSAVQVRKFARLLEKPPRDPFTKFRPPAVVIVPFKGIDTDLAAGIRALCEQDYPSYELILVVDSANDPAHAMLTQELAHHPHRCATVLVAGPAGPHEGQKIHNQLAAIDRLLARSADEQPRDEVWVFADSDAVPGPNWLGDLVGPLLQGNVTGVTTGYRWLIPPTTESKKDGPKRTMLWSHWASIMNSSVACLYGRDTFNHAWGGSMAVRADTAQRGDLRGRLTGALCDDYQFSRMSRDLGLRIYFVPTCLVATPADFDLKRLVNFVHRQYLLTRVYAPKLFTTAVVITSLYVTALFSATAWLAAELVINPRGTGWWWLGGAIACTFVANQIRSSWRARVIRRAFGSDMLQRLRPTLRVERWSPPIWMTLHWLLIMRSVLGRTMCWRGLNYRLYGPQRVERLDPDI